MVLWFPSDKGDPKFFEGMLRKCGRFPWKPLPYLLVPSSLDKEGLMVKYSHLSNDIYFVLPSFILLYRGGYFKIEVKRKEIRLDLFFLFLDYLPSMSRSDFEKCRILHEMGTG